MKIKKNILLILLLLVSTLKQSQCATIGSDSAVGRFSSQQTLNNGDRIAFFAALEAGFKINSADATATFDSTFPVSGITRLNLGTLNLSQDLVFNDTSTLFCLGNINGNNHKIEFSSSISQVPSSEEDELTIILLTTQVQLDGVTTLDWSHDNQYIVIGLHDDEASHDNIRIYSFDGSTLTQRVSDPLDLYKSVQSVRWHPSNYLFALSRLASQGNEVLIFEFNPGNNTITTKSSLPSTSSYYAASWDPTGSYLATGCNTNGKELALHSVDSSGVINPTPLSYTDLDVPVTRNAISWASSGEYLVVATEYKNTIDEVRIFKFDTQTETISLNASYNPNKTVNSVDWNQTYSSYIAVGLNGTSDNLKILQHDCYAGTLAEIASDGVSSNGAITSIFWSPNGQYLAIGRTLNVSQHEFEVYEFENNTLTKLSGFDFSNTVNEARYSLNGTYIAIGTDTWELKAYQASEEAPTSYATFDNLNIILNSNISLANTQITFSGNSSIIGRGNSLTLMPSCTFIVDSNSTLLLKDIVIENVNGNNIDCIDNSSTIELGNAAWILDNNYSFTVGKLNITGDFEITGKNKTFSYQSTTTSFIRKNAKMILGNDLIFYYAPSISNNQLINLTDNTSKIVLNRATLQASSAGLQLTKGILEFKRTSYLSSEGSSTSEAIKFGDGASSTNNLTIKPRPAVGLEITQGYVVDNNV